MSYRSFLLIAAGVVVGAATISAVNVSAHELGNANGERRGNFRNEEGIRKHGPEHKHEFAEELLGLSTEELKAERDAGKTMEEIVEANGYESIESFRDAVEQKVREELTAKGLSEEEINERLEHRQEHRQHRIEHMSEHFDEEQMRERLNSKGLSDEQIEERVQHMKDRIEEFNDQ